MLFVKVFTGYSIFIELFYGQELTNKPHTGVVDKINDEYIIKRN